jgi:predicted phosphodiesterase
LEFEKNMKLQILSDIHNEFSVLPVPHTDADVAILAGDIDTKDRAIEWAMQFEKPVLYVLGNHEFYGEQFQKTLEKVQTLTPVIGSLFKTKDMVCSSN